MASGRGWEGFFFPERPKGGIVPLLDGVDMCVCVCVWGRAADSDNGGGETDGRSGQHGDSPLRGDGRSHSHRHVVESGGRAGRQPPGTRGGRRTPSQSPSHTPTQSPSNTPTVTWSKVGGELGDNHQVRGGGKTHSLPESLPNSHPQSPSHTPTVTWSKVGVGELGRTTRYTGGEDTHGTHLVNDSMDTLRVRNQWHAQFNSVTQGAAALTVGSVLRGTILNYVIFIGC